jgi:uncharacterized LabA/DUF88 family protein
MKDIAVERCGYALRAVGKEITKLLCQIDSKCVFRVRVRLYHGWTSGITQTENRRAIQFLPEFDAPDEIFPSTRVIALSDIEFGDRLIDACVERESGGLRIHLPNTRRRRHGSQKYEEKMVDTALAVDVLSWARAEPNSLAFVVSSDDDLIPPVFVAEAWMKPYGGIVRLVRSRSRGESRYLTLEGLI